MARLGELGQVNIPTAGDSDKAYPWLLQLLPSGFKGVAFAALAAAIVSSLASMLNSTSTIFTMDIYKQYINKSASDKSTVMVGRLSAAGALVIACVMAPLLGGIDQAFQFIQKYTGMVSPGILAVFMLGLFWKKTTNKGAIWGALLSIVITASFNIFTTLPFLHQMGLSFLLSVLVIAVISYMDGKGSDDSKGIAFTKGLFKTSPSFNISAFAISIILVALYALLW